MSDQAQGLRDLVKQNSVTIPRILAVASGKGGVGKTNLSINLALTLIKQGQNVALLDADLGLANADLVLGVYPQYTLLDILKGDKQLNDIIVSGPLGLKIIAGSSGVYELANMGQITLNRFIQSATHLNHNLDFLFIDTSAGLSRNVILLTMAADEVLVVATSEPSSIADAYGLIKTILQRDRAKEIIVIGNMVRSPNEGILIWQKINTMTARFLQREVKYAGSVLYDRKVVAAVQKQKALVLAYPGCSASRSIRKVALNLLNRKYLAARSPNEITPMA